MVIQRIQSLYLLLACILCSAAIYCPAIFVSSGATELSIALMPTEANNFYSQIAQGSFAGWEEFMLPTLSGIIGFFSFWAIFWYDNFSRQIKTCRWNIFFALAMLAIGTVFVLMDSGSPDMPLIGVVFPVGGLLFNWLAMRGIKRDKKLLSDLNSGRLR